MPFGPFEKSFIKEQRAHRIYLGERETLEESM